MTTKWNSSFSCFFQTLQLHKKSSSGRNKKKVLVAEEFLQLRQLVHLHREVVGAHTHDTVPRKAQRLPGGWLGMVHIAAMGCHGGYDLGYLGYHLGMVSWDIMAGFTMQFVYSWDEIQVCGCLRQSGKNSTLGNGPRSVLRNIRSKTLDATWEFITKKTDHNLD